MIRANFIKESLYNCLPDCASEEYSRGVLVGLVSSLMATEHSFEESIAILKQYTVEYSLISDLRTYHVRNRLPDLWKETWDKVEVPQ